MAVTAKRALKSLDRFLHTMERANASQHKGELAGDSITGEKYRATALNWFRKADDALATVREFIEQEARNAS